MSFQTLVTCAELSKHLDDPNWRLFDCRHRLQDPEFGEQAYAKGHLPGAFFMHLDTDLSGEKTGKNGRHPLPDQQKLADKLSAAGVSSSSKIVVYDDSGGVMGARLWCLLRWLGHENVALLDGGIKLWVKEARALCTETPRAQAALFVPKIAPKALLLGMVSTSDVLKNLETQAFCVLDARSPDRFRGENETLDPRGGHIPGARNRFFQDNLDETGCFRSASALHSEFLAVLAGFSPEQAVMQCGSGITACHNLLALEIAGLRGARLYPGSWSEWCSDPTRPIAQ